MICQVRFSLLKQADLTRNKGMEIIDFFLLGKGQEPPKEDNIEEKFGWNQTNQTFANFAAQECDRMILNAKWRETSHFSVLTMKSFTDYGVCCRIFPWLDFENEATKNKSAREYSNEEFWSIQAGAKNGIKNGLELLLDAESHEYSYFPRSSKGLMVAISGPYVRPVVRQQGFYVAPGQETLVSVQVQETYTTNEALSFFPAATRKCYQDNTNSPLEDSEFQPKYFNRKTTFKYTLSNCLYASMIEKILTNCSCTPNFAIIGEYLPTNP